MTGSNILSEYQKLKQYDIITVGGNDPLIYPVQSNGQTGNLYYGHLNNLYGILDASTVGPCWPLQDETRTIPHTQEHNYGKYNHVPLPM